MAETLIQRSRNALVTAWHSPDRLLHPLRRRSALSRLGQEVLPTRILFICHGNICRSVYAARALTARLPPEANGLIVVGSAGFVGPGRPSPPEAVKVAKSRGVDLTGHSSRTVTAKIARDYPLIVTMDTRQQRAMTKLGVSPAATFLLGDLDPLAIRKRGIMDPYRRPVEVFEAVFERLDRCLHEFLRALVQDTSSDPSRHTAKTGASSRRR